MLHWFGDTLTRDGQDIVVNGARAGVSEGYAHIGGDTVAVRGWFGGEMVFFREVTGRNAEAHARKAARRAVEEAATKHFEQQGTAP